MNPKGSQHKKIPKSLNGKSVVDASRLAPYHSLEDPGFLARGYYVDKEFTCCDCGKAQVWTATQQKWWYEIARGDVFTSAKRCRECRRGERVRRDEARDIHLSGTEAKRRKADERK